MRTIGSCNLVKKAPKGFARKKDVLTVMRVLIRMQNRGASNLAVKVMANEFKRGATAYLSVRSQTESQNEGTR